MARAPSSALVVDTNILVGMILGARKHSVLTMASERRRLLVSNDGVAELMAVVSHAGRCLPHAVQDATALLEFFDPVPAARYDAILGQAAGVLRNAPASRNGSDKDAHVLALAWLYDADIWSHDCDFAGTGWPSWSSANLAAALSEEAAASATER